MNCQKVDVNIVLLLEAQDALRNQSRRVYSILVPFACSAKSAGFCNHPSFLTSPCLFETVVDRLSSVWQRHSNTC